MGVVDWPRALGAARKLARGMAASRAEADDLAQEAMLRLLRHEGRIKPGPWVAVFLKRHMVGAMLDHLRSEARPAHRAAPLPEGLGRADGALAGVDGRDAFERLIAPLPERSRALFRLHFGEGLACPACAARLGIKARLAFYLVRQGVAELREVHGGAWSN